jgi:histidinol phosphatase-like enzyme
MNNWGRKFIESETMNAFKATFNESEGKKYLFIDFDDTVRHSVDHNGEIGAPTDISEVRVFPGVGKSIKTWMENGYTVIGVTNQRGPLRRKDFLPPNIRKAASIEDAAVACGNVLKETLNKLGINFPILFASDATVFLYLNGRVSKVAKYGEENKTGGKAGKPSPHMGQIAFSQWGNPDLSNSYMIGDSYENADEEFAKSIGFQWMHPGPIGRDFIEYTNQKFGEEIEETGGYIDKVPFYGTHEY